MDLKAIMEKLNINDYFKYEPVVEYGESSVKVISTHNENLSNDFLKELTLEGITLKSVDTNYEYEDEFGIFNSTMWEFAPMKSLS